jgi:hypothetical protein
MMDEEGVPFWCRSLSLAQVPLPLNLAPCSGGYLEAVVPAGTVYRGRPKWPVRSSIHPS